MLALGNCEWERLDECKGGCIVCGGSLVVGIIESGKERREETYKILKLIMSFLRYLIFITFRGDRIAFTEYSACRLSIGRVLMLSKGLPHLLLLLRSSLSLCCTTNNPLTHQIYSFLESWDLFCSDGEVGRGSCRGRAQWAHLCLLSRERG